MTDSLKLLFEGTTTSNPPQTSTMDMITSYYPLIMLVFLGVIFYFMLIRPQRKRDKEQKEMMSKLTVGDKVTTIGGLVGVIAQIKDDEVTISTSVANTLVTYTKAAIQTVEKRESSSSASSASRDKDADNEEPKKKGGLFGKKKEEEEG